MARGARRISAQVRVRVLSFVSAFTLLTQQPRITNPRTHTRTHARAATPPPRPAAASASAGLGCAAAAFAAAALLSAAAPLPAAAEFRLPPIDSDPNRCARGFVGNTIGQANAVSDKILDLRQCSYANKDLRARVLAGALMADADFSGANMQEAVLTKAYAVGVRAEEGDEGKRERGERGCNRMGGRGGRGRGGTCVQDKGPDRTARERRIHALTHKLTRPPSPSPPPSPAVVSRHRPSSRAPT